MSSLSGRKRAPRRSDTVCSGFSSKIVIATAAVPRDSTEDSAAPATPHLSTKMSSELPMRLTMLISPAMSMDTRELPCARNSAAPALYIASTG